jgi:hypothetical protein
MRAASATCKKLLKVNNRPLGENSANLVTLLVSHFSSVFTLPSVSNKLALAPFWISMASPTFHVLQKINSLRTDRTVDFIFNAINAFFVNISVHIGKRAF